jgi:drug/metabolite transporter (DMT)-like permease
MPVQRHKNMQTEKTPGPSVMNPYMTYALTVALILLLASSPAVTRLSVTRTLTVYDLLFMRCGIGGLVFLPYFLTQLKRTPPKLLWIGFLLAFCQGWGMHFTTILGLQLAPAAHASALGPGFIPVWVAMWGWLFYRNRPSKTQATGLILISIGAIVLLVNASGASFDTRTLLGDTFFLLASSLGAIYLVYIQKHQIPPLQGASLVAVYSGLVFVPWFLLSPVESRILQTPATELLFQVLYQGLGVGVLFVVMLNYVVVRMGSQRFSIIGACVPILALVFGRVIAGDGISIGECAAIALISAGVLYGAFYKHR